MLLCFLLGIGAEQTSSREYQLGGLDGPNRKYYGTTLAHSQVSGQNSLLIHLQAPFIVHFIIHDEGS